MSEKKLREAWQEPAHADLFDARAKLSIEKLRGKYEKFNEFSLFIEHREEIQGRDFVEIACATGELYRYLNKYHTDFRYHGFDISEPAIERARQKYSKGKFNVCKPDLSEIISANINPAVVWARDVVHHQPDPFEFLSRLLPISEEITILRIRTRDKGASVLDTELSCQWHYNHWVPYIVLNVAEVIDMICRTITTKRIFITKNYMQLGGFHNRFLPKECYYPETGTAETAILIVRSKNEYEKPEVVVTSNEESYGVESQYKHKHPVWLRAIRHFRRGISCLF